MIKKLVTAFFVLYCGSAAAADFTYTLRSFPADNIQTCMQAARDFAAKFQTASGITPSSAVCEQEEYTRDIDIRISYSSDAEVTITSTESQQLNFTPRGFYRTEQECLADLSAQETAFAAETQLTPLLSYCFKPGYGRDYVWAFRIDAVGTGERKPFYSYAIADSFPTSPQASAVVEQFANFFAAKNAKLYKTAFKSANERKIVFFYYASSEVKFESLYTGPYPSVAACEMQIRYVETALSGLTDNKLAAAFCGSPYRGTQMSLHIISDNRIPRVSYSLESFSTFEQCETARPGLLTLYAEQYGTRLLGGVCNHEFDRGFRLAMFTTSAGNY